MNKIYSDQIEKAQNLVKGIKGNSAELKELYCATKGPIKQAYPLEQWAKFGLPDKR